MVVIFIDIHLCYIALHLYSVLIHLILLTFAFCKQYAARRCVLDWTSVHLILYLIEHPVLSRNILNSTWILMSVFTWDQIFPGSIALNRMYLNVQETTFRTTQILFYFGFLHQEKPKSQMMGALTTKASREVSWSGQQLPPASLCSFPNGLWCVRLHFYVGTSAAQIGSLVGTAGRRVKASVTCCPKLTCPHR